MKGSISSMKANGSLILLILLLGCLSAPAKADDLKPIDIAIGEWKPYVSQELEGYGEVPRKVTLILEWMGYRPNYVFMPWGQAEIIVRENPENIGFRGTFPFSKTLDRIKQFHFSNKPILKKCLVFFYNKEKIKNKIKGEPVLQSLGDLEEFNLGYIKSSAGYQYPGELQKILKKKGTVVDNDYQLFHKLIDSSEKDIQVEVVPEVKEVGLDLLFDFFPKGQRSIAIFEEKTGDRGCLLPVEYYFIISRLNPDNGEFKVKFDESHEKLIRLGLLEKITNDTQQQPSSRKPSVTLVSDTTEDYIIGRTGDEKYLLPKGTKGLLLDWQPNDDHGEIEARIYILSYPYRGVEVMVQGRYITLQ